MRAAVIQFNANNKKDENIRRALDWVHRAIAKKAEFIVLPEMFNFRGAPDPRGGFYSAAETLPGPSTLPLMALAKKHKVAILAGSVCEKAVGTRKVYNTSVLINRAGRVAAKYRKSHLFRAAIGPRGIDEGRHFLKGAKPARVNVGGWSAGLSVCYDLRFPELYRAYAAAGADILCVPSAFTRETGRAHWEILLRARAIENLCYVLAPNQCGRSGRGVTSYGHSMIISPWGEIMARASGNKEEVIFADLEQSEIIKARTILPGTKK